LGAGIVTADGAVLTPGLGGLVTPGVVGTGVLTLGVVGTGVVTIGVETVGDVMSGPAGVGATAAAVVPTTVTGVDVRGLLMPLRPMRTPTPIAISSVAIPAIRVAPSDGRRPWDGERAASGAGCGVAARENRGSPRRSPHSRQ
jgi:hypothetical protein